MSNVLVEYSDFSKENTYVEKITFDLLPSVTLILSQETTGDGDETVSTLSISMTDKETEETAITGTLDDEIINALIRSLSIFKGQMK
ncbi:MAG: hypothetical protein IKO36_00030 [Bacteroidaceae bacterium]|nr:hypothetical protein [Bacteroidaceae bacterium]